ncbi:MAG: hypothetical protein CMA91_03590 [Euryarchaeota archaeon]|mgnify:CR=1 FL=1|nr:hypothetical protein [Euryarchaeota archaeon]|tara:strand:- start:575 stop:1168 length:594 start_codon:yes stop_codon:yes gene_type:complete
MLEIINLTKSFNELLFENFNLELNPGDIIAITGPSGCGKTTLLRIICGLEETDSGDIMLDNQSIINRPAEKRNIGLIFQSPVLFPHFTVKGNLKLGNKNADISKSLSEVNLSGFEDRRIESLSGGEGQRVSIARALLANPKVLLLDEPFSSLDNELANQLVDDIRALLKSRKCPAILVTHNIQIAEKFADKVISINR